MLRLGTVEFWLGSQATYIMFLVFALNNVNYLDRNNLTNEFK